MKRSLLFVTILTVFGLSSFAPVAALAAGKAVAAEVVETVQLNQATVEQLETLPGVGPALAERIVAYRKEHGPFKSLEQLTEVKGIGQSKFAAFKDRLTLK